MVSRQEEEKELELQELRKAGNFRQLRSMQHHGLNLSYEGQQYLNLSSNDYLGLSASPYAQYPLAESLGDSYLHGSPSSRLMTGNSEHYEALEGELELLFPHKKALVLGCGFMANSGLPAALAHKNDIILADKLVHASLIDGMRLGQAEWKRFKHNDIQHLESLLKQEAQKQGSAHVWVMIESIYSMDGDLAPLKEMMALKAQYGFSLLVDEAHAFGVYGPSGKGLCAALGYENDVDVIVCTFGKAIAGAGACVLCSQTVRDYLINRMRTLIFSTALPPITLAWNSLILRQMRTEELATQSPECYPLMAQLRAHLGQLVTCFQQESGLPAQSHIIPIAAGSNEKALAMADQAAQAQYWLSAIRPPTVPQGSARLRLSLSAAFSIPQIQKLAQLCKNFG